MAQDNKELDELKAKRVSTRNRVNPEHEDYEAPTAKSFTSTQPKQRRDNQGMSYEQFYSTARMQPQPSREEIEARKLKGLADKVDWRSDKGRSGERDYIRALKGEAGIMDFAEATFRPGANDNEIDDTPRQEFVPVLKIDDKHTRLFGEYDSRRSSTEDARFIHNEIRYMLEQDTESTLAFIRGVGAESAKLLRDSYEAGMNVNRYYVLHKNAQSAEVVNALIQSYRKHTKAPTLAQINGQYKVAEAKSFTKLADGSTAEASAEALIKRNQKLIEQDRRGYLPRSLDAFPVDKVLATFLELSPMTKEAPVRVSSVQTFASAADAKKAEQAGVEAKKIEGAPNRYEVTRTFNRAVAIIADKGTHLQSAAFDHLMKMDANTVVYLDNRLHSALPKYMESRKVKPRAHIMQGFEGGQFKTASTAILDYVSRADFFLPEEPNNDVIAVLGNAHAKGAIGQVVKGGQELTYSEAHSYARLNYTSPREFMREKVLKGLTYPMQSASGQYTARLILKPAVNEDQRVFNEDIKILAKSPLRVMDIAEKAQSHQGRLDLANPEKLGISDAAIRKFADPNVYSAMKDSMESVRDQLAESGVRPLITEALPTEIGANISEPVIFIKGEIASKPYVAIIGESIDPDPAGKKIANFIAQKADDVIDGVGSDHSVGRVFIEGHLPVRPDYRPGDIVVLTSGHSVHENRDVMQSRREMEKAGVTTISTQPPRGYVEYKGAKEGNVLVASSKTKTSEIEAARLAVQLSQQLVVTNLSVAARTSPTREAIIETWKRDQRPIIVDHDISPASLSDSAKKAVAGNSALANKRDVSALTAIGIDDSTAAKIGKEFDGAYTAIPTGPDAIKAAHAITALASKKAPELVARKETVIIRNDGPVQY